MTDIVRQTNRLNEIGINKKVTLEVIAFSREIRAD
jgi:hypothetical protein